eukprot:UN24532
MVNSVDQLYNTEFHVFTSNKSIIYFSVRFLKTSVVQIFFQEVFKFFQPPLTVFMFLVSASSPKTCPVSFLTCEST